MTVRSGSGVHRPSPRFLPGHHPGRLELPRLRDDTARDSVMDLLFAAGTPVKDNLGTLLTEHPFEDDRDLLCTLHAVQSAGQARAAARAMADSLREAGIEPGQGVAVKLPSSPELVTTMAGIWLAGAVFVPLNDRSPDAEVARLVEAIRPAMVID